MSQTEKQQFRNNTEGWLGAVMIGPRGDDRGIAVEPGGTVWLSEAEQRLTANAPRQPEDNPFIERDHIVVDPLTGEESTVRITPLTAISEDRYVPAGNRPIPADTPVARGNAAAELAAKGDEPVSVVPEQRNAETRAEEVEQTVPPVPARAAAAAEAAQSPAPAPATQEEAVKVDPNVGEETGVAPGPQPPVQGEFAATEEVGTPAAQPEQPEEPAAEGEQPATPPQPYTGG